jgi:hypothetical protein
MTDKRGTANRLLVHYLAHAITVSGGRVDSDMLSEMGCIVDLIIDAAKAEILAELKAPATAE